MKLSKIQLNKVKEVINQELIARGINVDITLEQKDDRLSLSSSNFQTFPVLHKNICIQDFGVGTIKEDFDVTVNWICIKANYGGNTTELFTLEFKINTDGENIFEVITKIAKRL